MVVFFSRLILIMLFIVMMPVTTALGAKIRRSTITCVSFVMIGTRQMVVRTG